MTEIRLSEAIRLGSMLKPQCRNAMYDGVGTCALGAAIEAIGGRLPAPDYSVSAALLGALGTLRQRFGAIVNASVQHPVIARWHMPLGCVIVDLNDAHCWTREAIADWVATLEAQQEQPEPLRVTDLAEVV